MKACCSMIAIVVAFNCSAQKRVSPVVKTMGSVFEIPDATVKPDPSLQYKIVVDLSGTSEPKLIHDGLNNVARLINLHVSGGVPFENLDVVVAIHGDATFTLTDSKTYEKRYKVSNPNLELYKELADVGVKLVVCGQSLLARNVDRSTLIPQVQIATSALTTVTTHQLKGYAMLKFD